MVSAIINIPFKGTFNLDGESADSITADILLHDDTDLGIQVTMPQVDGGYYFNHTFTSSGHFKIRINGTSQTVYTSAYVASASDSDITSTLSTILSKLQDVHDATNDKNLAQVSDVEINQAGTIVKLELSISSDFLAGAPETRPYLIINGFTGEDASLNGEYRKWGNRNFSSVYSTTVYDDFPMWTNGNHAIYAVDDTQSSGIDVTSGEYKWQICNSDLYYQLVDETRTSITTTGREMYSLDKVVFSGEGQNIQILSADIMETSSSYGSHSTSNTKVGEVSKIDKLTYANYTVDITDNLTGDVLEINGVINEGTNAETLKYIITNHTIEAVNSNNIINHGIGWKLGSNDSINTNQPVQGLYGKHVSIDNTNGIGTVGDVSETKEIITFTINTPMNAMTEEQEAKIDSIQAVTNKFRFTGDRIDAKLEDEFTLSDHKKRLL